jgi:Uma2 family endonuclease
MTIKSAATVEDLYQTEGKAELVNGELVLMPPTGRAPGYAGDEIMISLRQYARRRKIGIAVGDNKAFLVNLPHRHSFSPYLAYYAGLSVLRRTELGHEVLPGGSGVRR